MNHMEMFKQISTGNLGSLYLLYGPEEYTKEEALNQMIEKLDLGAYADLNYQIIDGSESTADEIIAASETLPFLSERRLVAVKNYAGLSGKKAGNEDIMKKYLQRVPESTCLVFYQRGTVDKKRMVYKAIQKHGETVEFARLNQKDLVKWTSRRFRSHSKQISNADLEFFLLQVGNDLEDIKNEVDKLVSYSGTNDHITREAIDKLITPSLEFTVFQFIDAVSERQKGKALHQMEVLLEQGQSILGIISLIGRQLKIMMLSKAYEERGYSLNQTKDMLSGKPHSLHPYSVQKGRQQSRNFTIEQLRYYFDQCVELDYRIKNGKIKDRIGLEVLVIKICRKEAVV